MSNLRCWRRPSRGLAIDPIVIWVDNTEAANGAKGPFPEDLLDGRNRLAALALLGITDPCEAPPVGVLRQDGVRKVYALQKIGLQWTTDTDPEEFVFAANNRRHLSPELKREMIADCIKKYPQASNREIGRKVKADHKTVAEVRKGTGPSGEVPQIGQGGGPTEEAPQRGPSGPSGEVPQVGKQHLPGARAKAAVRANPGASANRIAQLANVGRATA